MTKNSRINEVCLSVYVDKKSGDLSVRLIDKESLVVIKEIPDQELVDIKDKIEDMTRLLFENV